LTDWLPRLANKRVYLYLFSSILGNTKKERLEQINLLEKRISSCEREREWLDRNLDNLNEESLILELKMACENKMDDEEEDQVRP